MLIGDTKGNVGLYNVSNGAKVKTMAKHNGEVIHVLAGKLYKADLFVTVGTDN